MPELPEMETYRRLLTEKLVPKVITDVEVNREKSINVQPAQFKSQLINVQITQIQRRAKHLIFKLSSGKNLLLHLMLGDGCISAAKRTILTEPNRLLFLLVIKSFILLD